MTYRTFFEFVLVFAPFSDSNFILCFSDILEQNSVSVSDTELSVDFDAVDPILLLSIATFTDAVQPYVRIKWLNWLYIQKRFCRVPVFLFHVYQTQCV